MKHFFTKKKPVKKPAVLAAASSGFATKFDKKIVRQKRRIDKFFDDYLERSGKEIKWPRVKKRLLGIGVVVSSLMSLLIVYLGVTLSASVGRVVFLLLVAWSVLFSVVVGLCTLVYVLYLDFCMYQRKQQLELVLPDFLQLASANISAGMPIDRALWLAVRPQFGILSAEMQEIAKSNFTGDDLSESLERFSRRYDSRMLKEAVSLIVAGIKSGGELGDLLARIAENIRETQLMQKEIAASVMSYVIFIAAATVGAAPVLLALSKQMLTVITQLMSSFGEGALGGGGGVTGGITLSVGESGVSNADFTIFAIVLTCISCYFAAGIISAIRKGNTHDQFKLFPAFALISIILFFAATYFLGTLFSGII